MKKQLMLILSALLLTLACILCGCSSGKSGGGKNDDDDGPSSSTSGPADETESVGLEFEFDESIDSYIVVGIGTCTDTDVVIPAFYEGTLVGGIAESAFKDCTHLTSITVPNSITHVFASSFEGCENLKVNMTDATQMHTVLSDWTVDTYATCQSEGKKHRTCLDEGCGSYFEEKIPKGEHTPSDWIIDTPASCLVDGSQHKECTVANCGATLETAPIPAPGHTPSDWIVDTPATCLVDGSQHKECTVETCGATLETAPIAAPGHTASDWIIDTPATCLVDGSQYKKCTVANCGARLETAPIAAPGHTASDWIVDTPATCLVDGSQYKKCTVETCGARLETAPITAPGHSMSGNICTQCDFAKESEGLRFTSNGDNTCYVSGIGNCGDEHIVIPSVSPDGLVVTGIGESAFENVRSIKSVIIPGSVVTVGYKAFSKSSIKSVVFSEGVQTIDEYAFWACGLSSLEIPASMTSIGHDAFYQCSSLQSVTFAENSQLSRIGNAAFHSTGLRRIELPDSVTGIGDSAFGKCSSLEFFSAPFVGCAPNSLQYGHFGAIFGAWGTTSNSNYVPTSIKTVVIRGGESINDRAFYGCNKIKAVVIAESVTNIGAQAFLGCSSLTTVYYYGTPESWEQITFNSDNTQLTNATRYYYSETEPTDTEHSYWHFDASGNPVAW